MKPITGEWVEKAEGDFKTAEREFGVAGSPNYDAVCFHAQQCAEKYLKARLIEAGVRFPKTHDLGALVTLLEPVESDWEELREALDSLSDRAVEVRYPGYFADAEDARESPGIAAEVRQVVRQSLGLTA